jgi:hypothetical protein
MQHGRIELTQGNINSNHFYLRDVRSLFPADAFGGANAAHKAHELTIDWGGSEPAVTDIDTKKMIFRRRGWVREFFIAHRLAAGDSIGIEKVSDYSYRLFPIARESDRNA